MQRNVRPTVAIPETGVLPIRRNNSMLGPIR